MALEIGPGVLLGGGITMTVSPMATASIYYSMQDIIGNAANGTSISSLTNSGKGGSAYNATNVAGKTAPTVATVNGAKVLTLNGNGNIWGYDIATAFNVSTGSLFMVGRATAEPARLIGFGHGTAPSGQDASFYGWTQLNNTAFLFRNVADDYNLTVENQPAATTMQVFGAVKTGPSTVIYSNNSTTPYTYPNSMTGTFEYNAVGYRAGYNGQPSQGYLGDLAWFPTALSNQDAVIVINYLKSKYNIT